MSDAQKPAFNLPFHVWLNGILVMACRNRTGALQACLVLTQLGATGAEDDTYGKLRNIRLLNNDTGAREYEWNA